MWQQSVLEALYRTFKEDLFVLHLKFAPLKSLIIFGRRMKLTNDDYQIYQGIESPLGKSQDDDCNNRYQELLA